MTAPIPPVPFTLGSGRYHVVKQIGEGGTSRIYLGLDTRTEAWRAVKVLRPELSAHGDVRERLTAEARTLGMLRHPHLLRVFAAGGDNGLIWFVMEYAERGSVDALVEQEGPLSARAAVEVLLQVCKALQHAHAYAVIHRDVTPRNILVDGQGVVKVGDFGVARILENRITKTGHPLGTLNYSAPEQLDSAKHVDARADVYAVGACLFRLLTGQLPQDAFLLRSDDPRLAPVPEPLRDVVLTATRYRPEHRYGSMQALAAALRRARAALPGAPPHPLLTPMVPAG